MAQNGIGLYAHFPWCVKKCPYCDFNSHPLTGSLDEQAYVGALLSDLDGARRHFEGREIHTVFLGGGTPSLFAPESIARLIDAIAPHLARRPEITMEANPGTTEHHDLAGYVQAGVTRLSIGAQSFDDRQLKALGRIHASAEIARAVTAAKDGGFDNLNLDLMYGLPGQQPDEALADLSRAIDLDPSHVSWYQLTIEPKTEFARRPPTLPGEDVIAEIETAGRALLAEHGYQRYEISAYARPGRRCRHNLNYWTFGDYVGIGAGAHGKLTGEHVVRTHKPGSPRLYLRDPVNTVERRVADDRLAGEFMMNALRLVEGVAGEVFEQRTGSSFSSIGPIWSTLVEQGLVEPDRISTTPLGLEHLDTVLQRFV